MARTFGLIGLIILFALALYYNKRNAQKRCTFLQNYINSNKEEVNAIIIAFFEGNLVQKTIDPLLRNKERAYLIINRNSYLTVIAMNNDKWKKRLN